MNKTKLIIKTKSKNYPIFFGNNVLSKTGKLIKKNLPTVKKICIINDNRIPKKLLKKLTKSLYHYDVKIFKLSASEKNKSLTVANRIIEQLLENNFTKLTNIKNITTLNFARTGIFYAIKKIVSPDKKEILLSPFTIFDIVNVIICAGGKPRFIDTEPFSPHISKKKN